jgi:hypothetical protein
MSVHPLLATAHLAAEPAATSASILTPGRSWSIVAAVLGLAGAIVGARALARSTRRWEAVAALAAGAAGTIIGGVVVAAAEGGPNTGYGIVGGYLSIGVGLVAVLLGGLALARTRRAAAVT